MPLLGAGFHWRRAFIASASLLSITQSASAFVCAVKIPGPELIGVNRIEPLPTGNFIIFTYYGAFTLTSHDLTFVSIPGARIGRIAYIFDVDGGGWLVDADDGFFGLNADATAVRQIRDRHGGLLAPAKGKGITVLKGDGFLLKTTFGLRFLPRTAEQADVVSGPELGEIGAAYRLKNGVWILQASAQAADNGPDSDTSFSQLYRFDVSTRTLTITEGSNRNIQIQPVINGLLLMGRNLRLITQEAEQIITIDGSAGYTADARLLEGFGWLVETRDGMLLLDDHGRLIRSIDITNLDITAALSAAEGHFLLTSDKGLFFLDATKGVIKPIDGTAGESWRAREFGDRGILVQSSKRLTLLRWEKGTSETFSYTPIGNEISLESFRLIAGGAIEITPSGINYLRYNSNRVRHIHSSSHNLAGVEPFSIGGGRYILSADDQGFFIFDSHTLDLNFVPGRHLSSINDIYYSSDGTILVAAHWGVFKVLPDFTGALTTVSNYSRPPENGDGRLTTWTLSHPCAQISDLLHLSVETGESSTRAGLTIAPTFAHQAYLDGAMFSARFPHLNSGTHRFQLRSDAGGSRTLVGLPVTLTQEPRPPRYGLATIPFLVLGTALVATLLALGALLRRVQ